MRFDKVIPVHLQSEDFGEIGAVARNISAGGMLIETPAPLPLGSVLRVRFQFPDSYATITARAEVKNHYAFNYGRAGQVCAARGMGVRFTEFVEDGDERLRSDLRKLRPLH